MNKGWVSAGQLATVVDALIAKLNANVDEVKGLVSAEEAARTEADVKLGEKIAANTAAIENEVTLRDAAIKVAIDDLRKELMEALKCDCTEMSEDDYKGILSKITGVPVEDIVLPEDPEEEETPSEEQPTEEA